MRARHRLLHRESMRMPYSSAICVEPLSASEARPPMLKDVSVLFSVVIQALYKPSRANTNLLRQIALIDQQTAQIATGRHTQFHK